METKEQKNQQAVTEKKPETTTQTTPPVTEQKKEEKKPAKVKKDEAVANGISMPLSKKHCMYISRFIKNKTVDAAIRDLEQVLKMKRAVPFKGEIPHRKGNIMSGRYPLKASKYVINVLKGLRGNIIVNGMDLEKTRIYYASASWASRPSQRGGARFKRAHLVIKAREVGSQEKKK